MYPYIFVLFFVLHSIVRNLVAANEGYAVVYSLGFGDDVKFDFLKRLSLQNHGFARKIYLNADSALQVQVKLMDLLLFYYNKIQIFLCFLLQEINVLVLGLIQ